MREACAHFTPFQLFISTLQFSSSFARLLTQSLHLLARLQPASSLHLQSESSPSIKVRLRLAINASTYFPLTNLPSTNHPPPVSTTNQSSLYHQPISTTPTTNHYYSPPPTHSIHPPKAFHVKPHAFPLGWDSKEPWVSFLHRAIHRGVPLTCKETPHSMPREGKVRGSDIPPSEDE